MSGTDGTYDGGYVPKMGKSSSISKPFEWVNLGLMAMGRRYVATNHLISWYRVLEPKMRETTYGREVIKEFMKAAGEVGLFERRTIPSEAFSSLFSIIEGFLYKRNEHVDDWTVKTSDADNARSFDSIDFHYYLKEGGAIYVLGLNGSGKSHLLVAIMKKLAMYRPINRRDIIATNVRLFRNVFDDLGIIQVNRLSEVMREIAKSYIQGQDVRTYLFFDEFDQILNAWRATGHAAANFFSLANQIRKLGISMVLVVHFFRDINVRHREGEFGYIFKGEYFPGNVKKVEDRQPFVIDSEIKDSAALWYNQKGENIKNIPDVSNYFISSQPTTFVIDFDAEELIYRLHNVPSPRRNTHDEWEEYYVHKGEEIQKFLDEYEERINEELVRVHTNIRAVRGMVVDRAIAYRENPTMTWAMVAKAIEEEFTRDKDDRARFDAAFPRGLSGETLRGLVRRSK